MHNKTRVVIYKGTIYKYKTHHPQYIEIITQLNDKNSYLIIYQSKSKWKYKFNSNTTNWIIQKFLLHQFNENKQTNQNGIDSTGPTTTRPTNIPSNTTTHTNIRTTNTNTATTVNTNTNTTTNTITNTNTTINSNSNINTTNTNTNTTTTVNTNTNTTTNSNSNTTNTNTSTTTTNTISLNLINDYLNDNDYIKQKTNSIIESLNDLFYATILYRNNKSNYNLSFKLSKTKFKWLHNYSQKSMNYIHHSLSSSLSTGSSCHSVNNSSSSFKKSYKSKSCKLIHSNSQSIDSTVSMISNLCISNELNTSQQMCTKNQPKYTTTTTTTTTNSNNNNNNVVNDTSNILLGLFLESGKHFIFEFNTIHERNLCLASLNKIITMNKQMNAYPDIEFAWFVNVHFKPKDYTSACLIPNNNGSHYLCLTCTEILLIQGNLRIPKLIILYRFVRQCVSRRDGQFRIYTGRASPIGECEIIFQLADHTEAVYVHEQFTRLMHQASVNTPSLSLSSSSSSSNSGWNRFGYSQNNLPPLPRPISLSQNNPLLSEVNLQPIKRLTRSKSISIIYNNNDNNSIDDDNNDKKNHSMNNNNKKNNLDYNECNIIINKKNVLHQSCPLLLNTIKDNYFLDHHDQQYSKEIKSIQNDHNDTIIVNNEIKEINNNPTSHYLEMNLCDSNIKEDNKNSVILRNQSILNNRIKAFSTCSPLDLMFTSSQLFNEIVSFKKVLCPTIQQQGQQQQQSSSSSISNSNIISHRDNNDLFAQLFFEKPHYPYSSSSYVIGKQDQLSSLTSLHYSNQSQSTSTRSHNSLFHNSNNNIINSNSSGINTTCNSMSSSLSPMMITTSSGSSIFFNCGNSIHGVNSNSNSSSTSSTNVRPRTSSDVSNMRRSYFYHSRVHYPHHLQQQSTMTQTHYLHHSQQRQEYSPRPLSTIDYQTSQNMISNLKLGRDLTSINELLPVNNSNIINPVSRPRAATTGSNLLLNKQRLSIVLNHLKMNWFKKQSNMKKITHHNFTNTNYATKYNFSSINDNTKEMNEDNNDGGNDDEYVETFPMNMNILSNNLNSLTLQTNLLPNLSNHYMIL
ncbi:unnamed protein product [Schistosoma margrebowiei]|uniref:IRS-type PTB domain-containing protein n=1 Tax=Schistosoma margrebowiei TaxID=48269 RepID=A0AA85AJ06_9TREM|nr:unnamed protein product [Schistosoma margrebowiei]